MKKQKCGICEKKGYLANHFEVKIKGEIQTVYVCARCFEANWLDIKKLWAEIYLSETDSLVGLS